MQQKKPEKFDYQNLIDFIWERVGGDNERTDEIMIKIDKYHEQELKKKDEEIKRLLDLSLTLQEKLTIWIDKIDKIVQKNS